MEVLVIRITIVVILLAMFFVFNAFNGLKRDVNDIRIRGLRSEMVKISDAIRRGADTFIKTEFKRIVYVIIILTILIGLFIEKTSAITFALGALMSSLVCIIGMKGATYANVCTAYTADREKSMAKTIRKALQGGSISGLSVQAFGLLGIALIMAIAGKINPSRDDGIGLIGGFTCNPDIMRLTTYSLGCSIVAMFNRIAGGTFTKSADISADMVSKVKNNFLEDDPRNPSVIADFVGDNVNDIAGNCSDLLESFVATIAASSLIAVYVYEASHVESLKALDAMLTFPILLATAGLASCLIVLVVEVFLNIGDTITDFIRSFIGFEKDRESRGQIDAGGKLDLILNASAILTIISSFGISSVVFRGLDMHAYGFWNVLGAYAPAAAGLMGIISGIVIGKFTEFYTSDKYRITRGVSEMGREGAAFVVTEGDAVGSRSCLAPVAVIAVALLAANQFCGIYGIAIAALGMLSFVAATVTIDAFGPIADNAGGIVEATHAKASSRKITDKLDAVGNTTAAIGKGFAIGSATFAAMSLIISYVSSYSSGEPILNAATPRVVAGLIVGGALVEFFIALLTHNTIVSAKAMADESVRQLSNPDILYERKDPDYERSISMATSGAIHHMVLPSLLAIIIPAVVGILFGPETVGGILLGATIVATPRAIFMGNSGGAFDNAKKYVEGENLIDEFDTTITRGHKDYKMIHDAVVNGDTIGDTRKDVVGVALDIFVKAMSTTANILAKLFVSFRIF